MPALTDTAIRAAKPADKPRKLSDAGGLYLFIAPTGGKLWRMKYRFAGKEKTLSIGKYPEVSLKDARDRRGEAGAESRKAGTRGQHLRDGGAQVV
jgi:hypothetical protein